MAINKLDGEATSLWGYAYADIPKSVFAVAAYHLANLASGGECSTAERMIEEIEALGLNGCINAAQAKRSIAALKKAAA